MVSANFKLNSESEYELIVTVAC